MILDIEALFLELGISPGRGKQQSRGWVNIECPFCTGDPGIHLGYNLSAGIFNCWRCGYKSNIRVVATLANCSYQDAKILIKKHSIAGISRDEERDFRRPSGTFSPFLPKGAGAMGKRHREYLTKRGLDVAEIERLWDPLATKRVQPLPWRIIIPIRYNSNLVSWQSRDITGLADLPYIACPKDEESVPHQKILYGLDNARKRKAIVVEGIFDAWRLGPGAVATFGISYSPEQALLLAEKFDQVFILFDPEEEAQKKAYKLAGEVSLFGTEAFIPEWEWDASDPAELKPHEAALIVKELLENT
jgi:DNA primase